MESKEEMEPIEVVIPGPERSYCALLDEALLRKQSEAAPSAYFPLRPSSAGYCGRKLAFELAAHQGRIQPRPEVKKPNIIRLLDFGHSVEFHALRQFQAVTGIKQRFKQQVVSIFKLDSGRLIEGSTDVAFETGDSRGLVDVKSVGVRWSKAYQNTWDEMLAKYESMSTVIKFDDNAYYVHDLEAFLEEVGEDALVANLAQLNLYLCSDFMQERGYDHGVIYRYAKNDSRHMEIRFRPSFTHKETIRQKFSAIEAAAKPTDIPRGAVLGSMACAFCPWASECWPEIVNTKHEYFDTLPKKTWPVRAPAALQKLFDEWIEAETAMVKAQPSMTKIIDGMLQAKIKKVRLTDNSVFEIVFLKSPKPRYELRRSKA